MDSVEDESRNILRTEELEGRKGGESRNSAIADRSGDELNEAVTKHNKEREAAGQRERTQEIKRKERQKKIDYMVNMPDDTPAGTGKLSYDRKYDGI